MIFKKCLIIFLVCVVTFVTGNDNCSQDTEITEERIREWVSDDETSCVMANTELGMVCGARNKAINGDDFVSFLGIPYAGAPIRELRFAEPQPPEPFEGILNATTPGPVCPQHQSQLVGGFMRAHSMSEDCLHINIHTPLAAVPDLESNEENPLKAIFVYLHGGSFNDGSGDPDVYGPEYLLSRDVLLVTFNFRLNSIGFLSLQSKEIPGNAGLRDVLYALKWIQRNIKNFGGDPTRVTLGGMSSGAAIAQLMALSPAMEGLGLIKRITVMSVPANSNCFSTSPIKTGLITSLFLQGMKINPKLSPEKIHEILIKAPIQQFLTANSYIVKKTNLGINFAPIIEIPRSGFTTILPKNPETLLAQGYGKEYDALFGFTSAECAAYGPNIEKYLPAFRLIPAITVPQALLLMSNALTIPTMSAMISKEYFKGSHPDVDGYLPFCSDYNFKYPIMRSIDKRLAVNAEPSFLYVFNYTMEGEDPLKTVLQMNWTGSAHSSDTAFVFRINSLLPPPDHDELAQNTSLSRTRKFLTDSVANFVKFGHPGEELADWSPCSKDLEFMEISNGEPKYQHATPEMMKIKMFFDKLYRIGRLEAFNKE